MGHYGQLVAYCSQWGGEPETGLFGLRLWQTGQPCAWLSESRSSRQGSPYVPNIESGHHEECEQVLAARLPAAATVPA